MHKLNRPPNYASFLLTFWEERGFNSNISPVWRFRLEEPHTRQQFGFASLEELIAFLKSELVENVDFQ